jgi:sensor histidine kinase YesM
MSEQWKRTRKEKLQAELSYLKAQINPHFLFNTLNSIYALAIDKSDHTATAVVKLSGMMRYVLSEAHRDLVSLQKELEYISGYIELQRLRLDDSVQLHFAITGEVRDLRIAPLILIPFVENAFKYGVNPEEDSNISIGIDITGDELHLSVLNHKVTVQPAEESGLGISNTRHRLSLLYPGQHDLHISDTPESFFVSLNMKLQ